MGKHVVWLVRLIFARLKRSPALTRTHPSFSGYKMEDEEVARGASKEHAGLPGQRGAAAAATARAPSPSPSKAGRKLTVIVDPDRPRNRVRFGDLRTEVGTTWSPRKSLGYPRFWHLVMPRV